MNVEADASSDGCPSDETGVLLDFQDSSIMFDGELLDALEAAPAWVAATVVGGISDHYARMHIARAQVDRIQSILWRFAHKYPHEIQILLDWMRRGYEYSGDPFSDLKFLTSFARWVETEDIIFRIFSKED